MLIAIPSQFGACLSLVIGTLAHRWLRNYYKSLLDLHVERE